MTPYPPRGVARGLSLLALYNVAFVVPVLALLLVVTSRAVLLDFTHWYLNYRRETKLALGSFVILLGLLALWIA